MSVATLGNLSVLQGKLLRVALRAHYRRPLDNEGQVEDLGCFGVQTFGRPPDPGGYDLSRRKASAEERRKRASARAAAGRAVARLVKRGLVECCSRGKWRLTRKGIVVARKLHPLVKPPSKREITAMNASTTALAEAIQAARPGMGRRRRVTPRAKVPIGKIVSIGESPKDPKRIAAAGEAGIEIPFDY
jgi:hypothetical protein